jgi:hypothetical protein
MRSRRARCAASFPVAAWPLVVLCSSRVYARKATRAQGCSPAPTPDQQPHTLSIASGDLYTCDPYTCDPYTGDPYTGDPYMLSSALMLCGRTRRRARPRRLPRRGRARAAAAAGARGLEPRSGL